MTVAVRPFSTRLCPTCGSAFRPSEATTRVCSRACWIGRSLADRFWEKVRITPTCWLWTASTNVSGYGKLSSGVGSGRLRTLLAPRVSWELHRGPIPEGLWVLHNCPGGDNPGCVNPDHLFLGDAVVNAADMVKKGRSCAGERHYGVRLTAEKVLEIRRAVAAGEQQRIVAKQHGVHFQTVFDVVHRRTWTHLADQEE